MITQDYSDPHSSHPTADQSRFLPRKLRLCISVAAVACIAQMCLATFSAAAAAHVQVIKQFGETIYTGARPQAPLIQGSDGALYGTTPTTLSSLGYGVVFKINPDGTGYTPLHLFHYTDGGGYQPLGGLVKGKDGGLYGTTHDSYVVVGTVFTINENGSGYHMLHLFSEDLSEGSWPRGSLIQASDGYLYGTTSSGDMTNNAGTVFKLNSDGSYFQVLHSFTTNGIDGQQPYSGLLQSSDGALYGTTLYGGISNAGTVFKINMDGSGFQTLLTFVGTNGSQPSGGLVEGTDGALYGTTYEGGSNNVGTVFKVRRDGTGHYVLFECSLTNAGFPNGGLLLAQNGVLYGTAWGDGLGGAVFSINQDGSGFQLLHDFSLTRADGSCPAAPLMQGQDGMLYGTCSSGGAGGAGTIFRLRPDGAQYSNLWSFVPFGGDGSNTCALVEGTNGVLFGASNGGGPAGGGAVFRLNRDGSCYTNICNLAAQPGNGFWYPATTLLFG